MNDEVTRIRGRLAEYKQRFETLDLSAGQDIITIRNLIDPYEPDVTNIRTAEAKVVLERLHKTVTEMREMVGRIKELEEALK
jgi:hypothetical protein